MYMSIIILEEYSVIIVLQNIIVLNWNLQNDTFLFEVIITIQREVNTISQNIY